MDIIFKHLEFASKFSKFILFCLNQYMSTLKVKGKSGGDPKKGQRGGGGEAALGEGGLEGEG